jgi:hypothetical protein
MNTSSSDNDTSLYESGSFDDETIDTNKMGVIKDIKDVKLINKEIIYYNIIDKYYKKLSIDKIKLMVNIIERKSNISLRLLEWFVTKYSKSRKLCLNANSSCIETRFDIFISYKAQLKSYRKRYFDPFRRRVKFKYFFDKEKKISLCTTISQLNFFKWMFTNNIIDYVTTNYDILTNAMGKASKNEKDRKSTNTSSIKKIDIKKNNRKEEIKTTLSFN